MKNKIFRNLVLSAMGAFCLGAAVSQGASAEVGLDGNAYITEGFDGAKIGKTGVHEWKNADAVVSVFFSLKKPKEGVRLFLKARGNAEYEVSVGGKKFNVAVNSEDFERVPVGTVSFDKSGYQRADIRAVSEEGDNFGEISALELDGVEVSEMNFVHDFSPYWGRRGPSVHLSYWQPKGVTAEYFYNEMYVPEGMDPIGSFYMVCGFGEGYFGAQVNSEKERRVLFSVWSPYDSDHPGDVPEEDRVLLKKKGEKVHVGTFGAEGNGGQSFLVFPWRAGTPYKFLVRVRPCDDGTSEYSGFFFAPEEKKWTLIATFRRPKTQTWLKAPNSFLENFKPEMGWLTRCCGYSNQWLRDTSGNWHELNHAVFSCDATGNAGVRIDYAGGVAAENRVFVLANCGFFDGNVSARTSLERVPLKIPPDIDFAELEKLATAEG